MQLQVTEDACIGCGACASICSAVFEISDDGVASVKVDEVEANLVEEATDAMECCPTGAISEI